MSKIPETILITGIGTGVGWNIAKFFSKKNYRVFGTFNKSRPAKLKIHKKIKIDLSNPILKKFNFDYLVHCASKVPKDGQTSKNYNINKRIVKNLINFAKKANCKKIIFLSAVSVYGKPQDKFINERTKVNHKKFYSKSKLYAEKHLIDFSKKENVTTVILRCPGILGNKISNNFIANLVHKAYKNLPVTIYNFNQYFNNIIHIETLSKIIFKSIKLEKKNVIYLVGSTRPIKIKSLINLISNYLKKKIRLMETKKKNKNFLLRTEKIRKRGYEIISTQDTLLKYLLNFKNFRK